MNRGSGQRTRVAIVGGGMAGLTAAYELSRTEELQQRFDVTVYQMGWRLGGKCASGRHFDDLDPTPPRNATQPRFHQRSEEHGLHVWFGYYDNAFRMMREVYDALPAHRNYAFRSVDDAFEGNDLGMYGGAAEEDDLYNVSWPPFHDTFGEGDAEITPWRCVERMLRLLATVIERRPIVEDKTLDLKAHIDLPPWVIQILMLPILVPLPEPGPGRGAAPQGAPVADTSLGLAGKDGVFNALSAVNAAHALAARFDGDIHSQPRENADAVLELLDASERQAAMLTAEGVSGRLLHLVRVVVQGLMHDLLFGSETVDSLDRMDFRGWLLRHGGHRPLVHRWVPLRMLYDAMFQHVDGDERRPSYAAGTALQVLLRAIGTSRQSLLFLMCAGTGETVISPLYRLLVERKVKFAFFHKLRRIELSADSQRVQHLHFDIQALVKASGYTPVRYENGFDLWPHRPFWQQLENGEKLRGHDFESHWGQPSTPAGRAKLTAEEDFDSIILAIPLGAFKALNSEDASPCEALFRANRRFAEMAARIGLVPSVAAQFWMTKDLAGLAPSDGRRAAACAGPSPLSVWTDMSPLLRHEPWPEPRPRSVQYLCGTLHSSLHTRPASDRHAAALAEARVYDIARHRLERQSARFWPGAYGPQGGGRQFRHEVLHPPQGDENSGSHARLRFQYLRANVGPSDCCVGSAAGSTQWRLGADESGFDNLFLAGDWIRTGLNTACVESAVIGGMQAARSIAGAQREIYGEHFLRDAPESWRPCDLARDALQATARCIVDRLLPEKG